jgi:response regulator RpfG family c-di-GMP phosphodiesterase
LEAMAAVTASVIDPHQLRLGAYADALARLVGMEPSRAMELGRISAVHDVGLASLPHPERLLDAETGAAHTGIGARLLGVHGGALLQRAARLALEHHERYDGSGRPAGLMGLTICVDARILAVAQCFMDLADVGSPRRVGELEARRILLAARGWAFDPEIVAACLSGWRVMLGAPGAASAPDIYGAGGLPGVGNRGWSLGDRR